MSEDVESLSDGLAADVVVLGSGPGGSIAACLLAEAGRDVLLVEEGEYLDPASAPAFSSEEMVQKYRNGGLTVALGRPKVAYVEGRCVGGGSEINSGLYHRAPEYILEEWRRSHQVKFLFDSDLVPHYEANERELCVSTMPCAPPMASLKLYEGARRLGWESNEIPRWFRYDSAGVGTKQSMTRTFVPRALAAGTRLLSSTKALRIRRRADSWRIEVEQRKPGRARRRLTLNGSQLIVSCGAIQTPALLRRSGIGRHVGDNLHMHPTVKVIARFPEEVNHPGMGVPVHQVRRFSPRISLGCSISGYPHLKLAMIDHPKHQAEVDRDWRHMASYYAMIRGGRGSVRALPGFRDPLVRYQLSREDLGDLAEGVKHLSRCLFAAGAESLYLCTADAIVLKHENDLGLIPSVLSKDRTNLMTIHLFSTCPMGEDQKVCVSDSFGRVHGEKRLWIADASLLPGSPSLNPQGTVMGIVRRNMAEFLGKP